MLFKAPYKTGHVKTFTDEAKALDHVEKIYNENIAYIRQQYDAYTKGKKLRHKIEACYPYVALELDQHSQVDTRLSYGFLTELGRYQTTLTRLDIYKKYYSHQFKQLLGNHPDCEIEVGVSETPIPVHFAFHGSQHIEGQLSEEGAVHLRDFFSMPDLANVDDSIANGSGFVVGQDKPLALFSAPRIDYSLQRLRHYTGTSAQHFQSFVIFTNYQFYVDEFVRMANDIINSPQERALHNPSELYTELVEPEKYTGTSGGPTLPQMPAYHLKRADGRGVTIVNIGVGPSNARNISDHVAVLRPDAWIMLGHCAGLRSSQKLGDYVLAHGYVRDDHALDSELPLWVPMPPLAEVQVAIEGAVAYVTGRRGYNLKAVMRTGTVVTTDNRNWEISGYNKLVEQFCQSRAIALDMESAVIAANGFRYRVPYGTLLCVSDRPLHGEIKLPGMASDFYKRQVSQHLAIGLRSIDLLRQNGLESLHSRKLRSFAEVAFR